MTPSNQHSDEAIAAYPDPQEHLFGLAPQISFFREGYDRGRSDGRESKQHLAAGDMTDRKKLGELAKERDSLKAQILEALHSGTAVGLGHAVGCERNEHNEEADCDCYLAILNHEGAGNDA